MWTCEDELVDKEKTGSQGPRMDVCACAIWM